MSHSEAAETHHDENDVLIYCLTGAALIFFTVVTVVISYLDFGILNMPVALLIACTKAALVMAFFMHLRHADGFILLYALLPIFLLALLIGIDFLDYFNPFEGMMGSSVNPPSIESPSSHH